MAYQSQIVLNLGAGNTGLTLNGKLYDSAGVQVGATITSGFVELPGGAGVYTYLATLPDGQVGSFVGYKSTDPTIGTGVAINPQELENTDAKTSTRAAASVCTETRLAELDAANLPADVAAVKADTASVLARLGAITGTGINTVLGYFRALVNKLAGLTPTDLTAGGGGFLNTTDSTEAIADAIGGGSADWSAAERAQIRNALGVTGTASASTGTGLIDLIKAKTDTIGAGVLQFVSPVTSTGSVEIVIGDDYYAADGRALDFTNASGTWPNLTGATPTINFKSPENTITQTGTVVVPTGPNQQVRFEIARVKTLDFRYSIHYQFEIQALLANGRTVTLVPLESGKVNLRSD